MNRLLLKLQRLKQVPIPQSTENPQTYWFNNDGTLQDSSEAIVINASDPVTGANIGGIAYVIHNSFHSPNEIAGIAEVYARHPHVVTINEAMADESVKRYNQVIWELCLTPVKVLGIIQKGYEG